MCEPTHESLLTNPSVLLPHDRRSMFLLVNLGGSMLQGHSHLEGPGLSEH